MNNVSKKGGKKKEKNRGNRGKEAGWCTPRVKSRGTPSGKVKGKIWKTECRAHGKKKFEAKILGGVEGKGTKENQDGRAPFRLKRWKFSGTVRFPRTGQENF